MPHDTVSPDAIGDTAASAVVKFRGVCLRKRGDTGIRSFAPKPAWLGEVVARPVLG